MAGKDNKKMKISQEDPAEKRIGAREKKEKGFGKNLRLCVGILFIFILISCRTTPRMSDVIPSNANFLPLESGASVYIIADARKALPIIDLLQIAELNDGQTRQIIEKTNFFAAALFPQTSGRRFHIAAWGKYPSSQADLAFSFIREWQKGRSRAGGSYWFSRAGALSIAMTSRRIFIGSCYANVEPFDPVTSAPGMEIPEGFNEFRRGSILSCWLENPAPMLDNLLNNAGVPMRVPVKKIFVNLLPEGDQYQALIRLVFETPSHARGMTAILNMAAGLVPEEITGLFLANPPVFNGNNVDIESALLNGEAITRLFGLFQGF
jgi:hypothetical protein